MGAIDNGSGVVGVAPGARLWAVRVLDNRGSGFLSWVLCGVNWVAENAGTVEVANMSLGFSGTSVALNDAIDAAVARGIVFAVAAGNSNADAGNNSPANHPAVLTVSALADSNDLPGAAARPPPTGPTTRWRRSATTGVWLTWPLRGWTFCPPIRAVPTPA